MVIKNAEFITSAKSVNQFIKTDKPVIAICGKSNVGKSSLINMLANRKKLAKTSDTPGRTRLINYFDFGEFILADLPGYGFAKVSRSEKEEWGKIIDDFFANGGVTHCLSLVDIRHDPTVDDLDLIKYFYANLIPFSVVATKADKLGKTHIKPAIKNVANCLKVGEDDIVATSSQSGYGKDALLKKIEQVLRVSKE